MHSVRTWGFKTVKSDREQEHRRSGNRARPGSSWARSQGRLRRGARTFACAVGPASCAPGDAGRGDHGSPWPPSREPRCAAICGARKGRRRAAPAGGAGRAREARTVRVPGEAPSCRPARDAFQSHAPSPGCRARPVPSLCGHHTRRPKCSDLSARAVHLGAVDVPGSKVSGRRRGAETGTGDRGPSCRGTRWGRGGPGSATPAGIASVRGLGNARVCVPKERTSRTRGAASRGSASPRLPRAVLPAVSELEVERAAAFRKSPAPMKRDSPVQGKKRS